MRRSLIPLALSLAAFATPAFSQSANLANPAALREQAPAVSTRPSSTPPRACS